MSESGDLELPSDPGSIHGEMAKVRKRARSAAIGSDDEEKKKKIQKNAKNKTKEQLKIENTKQKNEINNLKQTIENLKKQLDIYIYQNSTNNNCEQVNSISANNDETMISENNNDISVDLENKVSDIDNIINLDEVQKNNNSPKTNIDNAMVQNKAKKFKPPPIIIVNENIIVLKNELIERGYKNFSFKKISEKKQLLRLEKMDEYRIIKQMLKQKNSNFFTYTPKEEKMITLILKGLNTNDDPIQIKNELDNLNVEKVEFVKVERFSTKFSIKNNKTLAVFLVQVTANSEISNVFKIKQINYQMIKWERLIRNEILQCKKCQRLGHTAINCNLEYRCVKCNLSHQVGVCTVNEKTMMKCALCGEMGHPASYRGCKEYLRVKGISEQNKINRERQIKVKKDMYQNFVNPMISFSNIVDSNKNLNNNSESPGKNNVNNNILENMNIMLNSINNEVRKINNVINNHTNKINHIFHILELDHE